MDGINPCIQAAISKHGVGTVIAVLDAIGGAHSVRTERAPHGFFMKAFFTRRSEAARTGCSRATKASTHDEFLPGLEDPARFAALVF